VAALLLISVLAYPLSKSSVRARSRRTRDISDGVPAELWHQVFQYACVDGGQTGCALSLVSRHIRELSAGIRFQSVIIVDPERLNLLLRALKSLSGDERRVRFLFIGARQRWEKITPQMYQFGRADMRIQLKSEGKNQSYFQRAPFSRDDIRKWRVVYTSVLALIAPHVEVLAVHIPRELLDTVFPAKIDFPVLQELAFAYIQEADELLSLPLLRRLHVFGPATKAMIYSAIDIQGLQRVRFSDYRAVDEFAAALGEHSSRLSCVSGLVRSTKLVITPDCPSFRCGNGYFSWAEDHRRTRDLLMQHQNSGRFGTITVLEPSPGGYNLDAAVNDWRDAVENGGEGVWGREVESSLPRPLVPARRTHWFGPVQYVEK
jgi:hypothetical protein